MYKTKSICLIIVLLLAMLLPGCTNGNKTTETTASSSFMGVLGMVPYSFFEECDIQYGNFGMAREMHGAIEVTNLEELAQLTKDEKLKIGDAMNEIQNAFPTWLNFEENVAELTGISIFSFNRIIYISSGPPHETWIATGNFDEALIEGKLTALGYGKIEYGKYSYYSIRDDFQMDLKDPLGRLVMAQMNRVAVLDNILIISPTTEDVKNTLDTMDGKASSILNDAVCKSLAERLGEPLAAALTTPERIINSVGTSSKFPFSFTIPEDWGRLRGFEAAGLGYSAEGEKRYFNIVLDYKDKSDAEADGEEIIKRMNSYSLTLSRNTSVPFTDIFRPGVSLVKKTGEDFMLNISCELIEKERWGIAPQLGGGSSFPVRDLLFLAPEPSIYVK